MPRHSKHDKAKRPWYNVPLDTTEKSEAQKIFAFALHHDWELRPMHLGIWVIGRKGHRLHVTFTEGGDWQDCIYFKFGEDGERKLTMKQMLHLIKRLGRLYYP